MPDNFSEIWMPSEPDERVADYPLMGSFWPTTLIIFFYLIVVLIWMKTGAPKSNESRSKSQNSANGKVSQHNFSFLTCLLVMYNLVMVLYSSYVVIEIIRIVRLGNYGLGCVDLDRSNNEIQRRSINIAYIYFLSKFAELLDTVFFLLRGKYEQVTFLHVFHHAAMPPSIWWCVKYAPGGIVYTKALGNSFVHAVMYTYYGMAALGLRRYLWWKRYLTILQMIQFCFFIVHQSQVFTPFNWDCRYPKIFPLAIIVYSIIFLVLFGNFYVQAYWHKRRLSNDHGSSEFKFNGKDCTSKKGE